MPSITLPASLTDGVVMLRPFKRGDAEAIVRNCSDPEVPRWTRVPFPYTVAHADLFLDRLELGLARGEVASLAVGDGDPLVVHGAVTLQRFEWEQHRGDVGYYLGAGGRGRGLMTRAVRLMTGWGFAALGLERVQLHAAVGNEASQRVAERAGYTREGVLRAHQEQQGARQDMVCYSRLPGDEG